IGKRRPARVVGEVLLLRDADAIAPARPFPVLGRQAFTTSGNPLPKRTLIPARPRRSDAFVEATGKKRAVRNASALATPPRGSASAHELREVSSLPLEVGLSLLDVRREPFLGVLALEELLLELALDGE